MMTNIHILRCISIYNPMEFRAKLTFAWSSRWRARKISNRLGVGATIDDVSSLSSHNKAFLLHLLYVCRGFGLGIVFANSNARSRADGCFTSSLVSCCDVLFLSDRIFFLSLNVDIFTWRRRSENARRRSFLARFWISSGRFKSGWSLPSGSLLKLFLYFLPKSEEPKRTKKKTVFSRFLDFQIFRFFLKKRG